MHRGWILAATLAALPASAQDEAAFSVALECHGELPMVVEVEARRAGRIRLALPMMIEACVASMKPGVRWRSGA